MNFFKLTIWFLFLGGLIVLINGDVNRSIPTVQNDPADPQGYLDSYMMRRGGKIDPRKISRAFKEAQRFYKTQNAKTQGAAGLKSWTWKGPGNIGGRVRALAVRDNGSGIDELFAGSSGGGILHSTDAGATWNFVNDFLPSLIVTCIVIDPTNQDRILASTGDGFGGSTIAPGAGIMFSVDGGLHWGVLPGTSEWYYINKIALDPSDPATIYAVRSIADANLAILPSGRIEKSTTAGLTWEEGWVTTDQAVDVEINLYNSEDVLVGTRNGAYRSVINDGIWDFFAIPELSGLGRCEIAFAPSNPIVAYALLEANNGSLYRSSATSWTMQSNNTDMGPIMWHYNSLFVDPNLSNRVIAGGLDVYRSIDAGITFDTISDWNTYHQGYGAHADNHIFVPSVNYTDSNPVVYVGNDGGVQRIDDIWTGTNPDWENLANATFGVTQFYGGDARKDGSLFIGGTQDNCFTLGSGLSDWVQPRTGDGSQAEVNYLNEQIMYVNLNSNNILKSIDGGTTWTMIASFETTAFCNKEENANNPCCQPDGPGLNGTACIDATGVIRIDDNCPVISEFIMDPDDPTILYTGGNQLWRINDNSTGPSVSLLTTASGVVTTIAAADNGLTLWAGFSQQDLRASFDGGNNWIAFEDLFTFTATAFTDVAIDPQNSNRVLVSLGGYTTENLYLINVINQSPNQSILTDISLPFPMQVNSVTFHPTNSNWLYIGTDVGVFASEDSGQNWSITPIFDNIQGEHANEGPIYSIVEELFWYGNGSSDYPYYLAAATFGRGMWATSVPVYSNLYVDKNYSGIETGSFAQPFNTFAEANNAAAPGVTIVFKSSGIHNEVIAPIVIETRTGIEVSDSTVVIQ